MNGILCGFWVRLCGWVWMEVLPRFAFSFGIVPGNNNPLTLADQNAVYDTIRNSVCGFPITILSVRSVGLGWASRRRKQEHAAARNDNRIPSASPNERVSK